ncbi:tetratricopeptide repeat protein [Desulfobaculum senezii]
MSKTWIRTKRPEFVRDVVRDFCLVHRELEKEFRHYDKTGHVDFSMIRNLLGQEMNKGLLWRLKDTAHLLFKKNASENGLNGQFLDWSIGYIFHDTIKLKEDAYQQQNYAPWFRELQRRQLSDDARLISQELMRVLDQTNESIEREIGRIRFILFNCRRLLIDYLALHRDNELLARFLLAREELVREVFGSGYARLLESVYGDEPELLYLLAARSLREGGWREDAMRALTEAERINADHPLLHQERGRICAKRS